jgi:hypothetical protein
MVGSLSIDEVVNRYLSCDSDFMSITSSSSIGADTKYAMRMGDLMCSAMKVYLCYLYVVC